MSAYDYKLEATLDGETLSHGFHGADDGEATMFATGRVLDFAIGSDVWANGRIELTRLSDGAIIQTMEAKQ